MNVPKLRFKEFNDEYNALKLSDVAELTSSKRIYLSDYTDNGIPFYRGKEISELKLNKPVSDLLYISDEKYKEIEAKYGVPKENDILVTGVGTLGNIYRIPNNNKFYFKDGNLIWLKNIKQNSEYLEYNLEFNKKKLLDSAIGSTQKALTIAGLNKLSFCYPSTSEQTKVARTMQLIDIKINLQSKKIEDLKLFKKGLDIKIFNNKKLFDVGIIKEYFESDGGTALEKYIDEKGTYNIISIGNYTPDGRYYDNGQKVIYNEKTKMKLLSKNNLAMILNDKTTTGDIIGSTILIDEDNKYIYNQRTQKLICKNINAEYSWCFFNSKYFRDKVFRLSQGGTQIYVNYSQIENQKIFIPKNKKIENDIVKSIFLITKLIDNENDKFLKLQKLKKGLMQNMFV